MRGEWWQLGFATGSLEILDAICDLAGVERRHARSLRAKWLHWAETVNGEPRMQVNSLQAQVTSHYLGAIEAHRAAGRLSSGRPRKWTDVTGGWP